MLIVNQHKGDVTLKTQGPLSPGARLYNHEQSVISASVNYNCISGYSAPAVSYNLSNKYRSQCYSSNLN